jgi:hypothetical protein
MDLDLSEDFLGVLDAVPTQLAFQQFLDVLPGMRNGTNAIWASLIDAVIFR